jgi:hypothetical protein
MCQHNTRAALSPSAAGFIRGALVEEYMRIGDIVQIVDEKHPWYPCLLIVSEVKSWGVQACTLIPKSNDSSEGPGEAYNRLPFEQIAIVGHAEVWHESTPENSR